MILNMAVQNSPVVPYLLFVFYLNFIQSVDSQIKLI